MAGRQVADEAVTAEIAPAFVAVDGARTDVVVLACTHYPLLLDQLDRVAPWPVAWLDPAPAIARRTANVLAERGFVVGVGARPTTGLAEFTSRRTVDAPLAAILARFGLRASG